MMAIFSDFVQDLMEVIMNDFSVYVATFDQCLNNFSKVLQRCEDVNLVLNCENCLFMVQEGVILGHVVSNKGIEADKAKVEVIKKLPPPTSVKDMRRFLGHWFLSAVHKGFFENCKTSHLISCQGCAF